MDLQAHGDDEYEVKKGMDDGTADERRAHTAVMVIDMQNDFCEEGGFQHTLGKDLSYARCLLEPISALTYAARAKGAVIVWVVAAYGPPHESRGECELARPPWQRYAVAPMNDALHAGTHRGRAAVCVPGSWGAQLWAPLSTQLHAQDIVLHKRMYSVFRGTQLAEDLSARGVGRIVLCGVTANMCVQASFIDAFFLGFRVVVASDCVGSVSPKAKERAFTALQKYYGTLETSDHILKSWDAYTETLLAAGPRHPADCGVSFDTQVAQGYNAAAEEEKAVPLAYTSEPGACAEL
jgi:ureidoacrylate peracid hydrolase